MKVTKYPQSCLLLEKNNRRIVIDPGKFFADQYDISDLGTVEAVLYTHQHGDHYDASIAERFKSNGTKLYGNHAVARLIGEDAILVSYGTPFKVAGFNILPHDLPHFAKAGVEVPPNTGYIIDGNFFHPGDGIKNNGVRVNNFASPIAGPFDFETILEFIASVGAKKVIPFPYSNQELYPCDPNEFVKLSHQ